jgi:hypothetical protein
MWSDVAFRPSIPVYGLSGGEFGDGRKRPRAEVCLSLYAAVILTKARIHGCYVSFSMRRWSLWILKQVQDDENEMSANDHFSPFIRNLRTLYCGHGSDIV